MGSGDTVTARQTIPILVKYSQMMNNFFDDIQKVVPPSGIPKRVLYQSPPGSLSGTLDKAVGEVAVVGNPPTAIDYGDGSRPRGSGKTPKKTRSSKVRRKSTGSDRSGRGQSPVRRTSDRSRTPDMAWTPIKRRISEREAISRKGKSRAHQASRLFPPDCLMLEPAQTSPSIAATVRDPVIVLGKRHPEQHPGCDPTQIPISRWSLVSGMPGTQTQRAKETGYYEDEVAPSLNMRQTLTRLQKKPLPETLSVIGGFGNSCMERATLKKSRPS